MGMGSEKVIPRREKKNCKGLTNVNKDFQSVIRKIQIKRIGIYFPVRLIITHGWTAVEKETFLHILAKRASQAIQHLCFTFAKKGLHTFVSHSAKKKA